MSGEIATVPAAAAVTHDGWTELRRHTPARIALDSSGDSLPTDELLRFGVAHAQARDAVHLPMDAESLRLELRKHGFDHVLKLESAAPDRATYLRRPDLGRQLSARSCTCWTMHKQRAAMCCA